MGLSIVKKIIERHSGTITFESAAGEGTTFYIRIPEDLSALKTSKFGERNGNHK
ncbi:MAG TPA: ATP-binding protein [Candidatus Wallbacteria bacterium]|nr:ATP-binding protein [Candidatus Wallbacteria bacterium]